MSSLILRFVKDDSGATAIEYGLIAALVAVAIIGALQTMTGSLTTTFGKVTAALGGGAAAPPAPPPAGP
jgi:pilus assembly protein Flp/PilA